MHTITTSKFGKLNLWMQISFIILFMVDLYKNNHVRACVCAFVNFFFKKTSSQKLLTGLLPNFIVVFLRKRLKSSLHRYRKIRPDWSDRGAEAPLVLSAT